MITPSSLNKILVVKPSALGDIVHSLPFLAAVAQGCPGAEIHWVVARGLRAFLDGHPLIHRLWTIDKDQWKRWSRLPETVRDIAGLWSGLRREGFDVAVDLSGILRSGLIAWASGAPARLGFAESDEGSPLFYTHTIHGDMRIHAVDRYLKLAAALGCDTGRVAFPFAPYDPDPPICRNLPKEFAVIAPSAGKEANRWPAENFGHLAARLPMASVVVGGGSEVALAERVVGLSQGKAMSVAGKTGLKELVALIAKARFFVSNDTGPLHVAAGLNVPVVAIFGPANPARTGPYGPGHLVIRDELPCSPCYRWKPCEDWRCMEQITPERVWTAIQARFFS